MVVEGPNLPVHISTLRKVLGPQSISTISGRDCRFTLSPDSAPNRGSWPPVWHNRTDRIVAATRAGFSDDAAFDRAWREGRGLTIEQLPDLVLLD